MTGRQDFVMQEKRQEQRIVDGCLTEARVLTDGLWRRPRHGLAVNVFRVSPP